MYSSKKLQISTKFLSALHLLVINKHTKFDVDAMDIFSGKVEKKVGKED